MDLSPNYPLQRSSYPWLSTTLSTNLSTWKSLIRNKNHHKHEDLTQRGKRVIITPRNRSFIIKEYFQNPMPKDTKRAATKRAARIAKAHATQLPKLEVKEPPRRAPGYKHPSRGVAR